MGSLTKTALITGSNGGIGFAVATALFKDRYNLVLNYHVHRDKIYPFAKRLGETALLCRADVTIPREVKRMVAISLKKFGRIDALVNCAGIVRDRTLVKQTMQDWTEVLDVNLNGVYNVTKAVLPVMIQQARGTIVNVSSVIGEIGNFGQTNYAASKAALFGFTKSLAKEVASKGITVNAIAPGFVSTRMTQNLPFEIRRKILTSIPLGRLGTPEEIAEAVVFLCHARYVTGAILNINGGLT